MNGSGVVTRQAPNAASGRSEAGGETPRVSVVVPTYQRRASAERLLRALGRQTLPARYFEVIVVDDGSTDGTAAMVAAFEAPFHLELLRQPNRGRASACNAGIARARGELLVLLDDDMEPAPDLLAAHARAHVRAPRRGVIGAAPIEVGVTTAPVTRFVADKFNRHLDRLAGGGEIHHRSFYSGNFSIRRQLLLEAGAFDEGYRIYGNEDTELALRLLRSGVCLHYSAAAAARQHYEKSFSGLAWDSLAKGRTAVRTARKHPEGPAGFTLAGFQGASDRWTERSPKWKLLRAAFLALGRHSLVPARALVLAVRLAERIRAPKLPILYLFALDCLYWLGVTSAAREGMADAAPPRAAQLGAHAGVSR